jgi:hypothetical protein
VVALASLGQFELASRSVQQLGADMAFERRKRPRDRRRRSVQPLAGTRQAPLIQGRHASRYARSYNETTCAACRACVHGRRNGTVIGFPAHGGWRVVEKATAARDVRPGEPWTFPDHRTMGQVIADGIDDTCCAKGIANDAISSGNA